MLIAIEEMCASSQNAKKRRQANVQTSTPRVLVTCLLLLGHFLALPCAEVGIPDDVDKQQIDLTDSNVTYTIKTSNATHRIYIEGDEFKLDGESLFIKSGSLHYFRVPSQYWRDRLRKLKAAGLNSVSTYVEWSYHEPEERQYRFTGDYDVASFIRTAAHEGLHVLLRPGPYICAERDLGGLPYWLLSKYPNIKLRTTDKDFIQETSTWFSKLFEQITPLLFGNGGPIILVQIENEYGSFGSDTAYMDRTRDLILKHIGYNALLYTTDGWRSKMLANGKVSGALTTIDFRPRSDRGISDYLKSLRDELPAGPLMNSEFYTGWLTQWGRARASVSTERVLRSLRYLLRRRVNFNFYLMCGGTNFEFSSGSFAVPFLPHVTSYDYDAPLSEAGDPTDKYFAIRNLLKKFDPRIGDIPEPTAAPKGAYGRVSLRPSLQLLSARGAAALGRRHADVPGSWLPSFEALRQRAGFVLYETNINATASVLNISIPRDLVLVYVDGIKQGEVSRHDKVFHVPIKGTNGSKLSLLVENQGRVNFGNSMHFHDFKGILSPVTLDKRWLTGPWSVTGFPLEADDVTRAGDGGHVNSDVSRGPMMYEGSFVLPEGETPKDTFINPTGWSKGVIWVNGHNLGRYWLVGPQLTLFVPGAWLRPAPAHNRLLVLETSRQPAALAMDLIDHPILELPTTS